MSKIVETIEKALPSILSAGVIGLFTLALQFWALKAEVSYLRADVQNLKTAVQSLNDRSVYFHGEEVAPTRVAHKEGR